MDLLNNLDLAKAAAIKAGKILTSSKANLNIEKASDGKDIKLKADIEAEEIIKNHISNESNFPMLGEETGKSVEDLGRSFWVIDPLDGTYNFTRKFPFSGISIALLENNIPILGVVIDIFGKHSFSSAMGIGSHKNGDKIAVSSTDRLLNATLTTGFPSGATYETDYLLSFVKSVQEFKKVRALGAASLMLSLVAEGTFDVYYEKDIYLWDVAAGLSLIKEAGGAYVLRKTAGRFQYEVLASNMNISVTIR